MANNTAPILLIVGLGNPGDQYRTTRHNMGFQYLDRVAEQYGARFLPEAKFFGETTRISTKAGDVRLLKPTTFMNLSGSAVQAVASYYKIKPEEILVVHDELDLHPGTMRLKLGGGNAGHNGLKDITAKLSTPNFWRLRVGIGHPRGTSRKNTQNTGTTMASEVLERERLEEERRIAERLAAAAEEGSKKDSKADTQTQA